MENLIDVTPGPNYHKIDTIWAYVSEDERGEGIIAQSMNGMMMPFVASDELRIKDLMPHAKNIAKIAKEKGVKVKLIKFTNREEVETIS